MTSPFPKRTSRRPPARTDVGPLRAQHLALAARSVEVPGGIATVTMDDRESPLMWLARRKGKDGEVLIAPHHLLAGERLRADFTRAQLIPRTTSNWDLSALRARRVAAPGGSVSEAALAARQCVNQALAATGPEFSGLLLDVCCFLKGLEDVERERLWPRSSARIVLKLGLERLARHYGYGAQATGKPHTGARHWRAPHADIGEDAAT